MRKLEIEDPGNVKKLVEAEIEGCKELRYAHRLHGILLFCSGHNCYEVANLLGRSPRTVHNWVRRFADGGFSALEEKPHPGRPSALGAGVKESLDADLRRSPREFGYGQNLWDGKILSHHVNTKYGVRLGERQCRRLFHEFGFRLRKPRPVIASADPAAQASFKKTPQMGGKRRS